MNTACTIVHLIDKLFHAYPSYRDVQTCHNCDQVEKTTSRTATTVNATLPTADLIFLKDVLSATFTDPIECRTCRAIVERTIIFGNHLFIELTPPYENNFIIEDVTVQLKNIPRKISILDFELRRVIHFYCPNNNLRSVGHYTAYCLRNAAEQWEHFDDMRREQGTV